MVDQGFKYCVRETLASLAEDVEFFLQIKLILLIFVVAALNPR